MATYEVARGTRDMLPAEMAARNHVENAIRATFETYGFQQVQTPMFESFDLFAARSGEEIRESMFTFVSDHQEYALRPELTAAVCRLVASGKLAELPLPYKLYYIGECFRYCRPQAGRYREFTQAGLELMGSSDPFADAEVITVATSALNRLGVGDFRLKVGNIGIFRCVLEQVYPDDFDTQSRVIGYIDNIMSVREKCAAIKGHQQLDRDDLDYVRVEMETLYRLQEDTNYSGDSEIFPEQDISEPKAREALDALPSIAEDTYRTMWSAQNMVPKETGDLLIEISRMRGAVGEVMPMATDLLSGSPAASCLDDLRLVCELLGVHGVTGFEVVLGVARGLDFYTGTVFEIDSPLLGAQKQICGGGRYDRLVEEFGGRSIPATGFAFGFDRVVEAYQKSGSATNFAPVDVFVACGDDAYRRKAVETAEKLRGSDLGLRVATDLMGLDLREQLGYASSLGAELAVILGIEELAEDDCRLRNLSTRSEVTVPLGSVVGAIASQVKE